MPAPGSALWARWLRPMMNTLLRLLLITVVLYPMIGSAQPAPGGVALSPPVPASAVQWLPTYIVEPNTDAAVMSKRSRGSALRWAAIGTGIGVLAGLGAYAIVEGRGPYLCEEGEPGCTVKRNYSRRGFVVSFTVVGAVVGAVLGARSAR